jgi:hypothetical protein
MTYKEPYNEATIWKYVPDNELVPLKYIIEKYIN